jgi:alpha-L-fucosidase
MKVNSEAIYSTQASPFPRRLPWGRITQKTDPSGATTYYLHVWDWPSDGQLLIPKLQAKPQSARLLADKRRVSTEATTDGLVLKLTGSAPDPDVSVIALRFKSAPVINQPAYVTPDADSSFTLGAFDPDTHGSLGGNIVVEGRGPAAILTNWSSHEFRLEYQLKTPAARTWRVTAELRSPKATKLKLRNGKTEVPADVASTGSGKSWHTVELGTITLPAGETSLELVPVHGSWHPIDIKSLHLTPVP